MVQGLIAGTGYGFIVALTVMPILTVIAILLGTHRASRGWWYTGGYAAGLALVFLLANAGAARIALPSLQVSGLAELVAGVLLLMFALILWLMRQRPGRSVRQPMQNVRSTRDIGPVRSSLLGAQFAFHPENLVLTTAAATHSAALGFLGTSISALWFILIGVSSVALPTLWFARAGARTRDRMQRFRDRLVAHGPFITIVLLGVTGILLAVIGIARVLF